MTNVILDQINAFRQRSRRGDDSVVEDCQREFGGSIRRLVRHMLRTECFTGELGELVVRIQHQLSVIGTHSREELIREITSRVCAVMVGAAVAGQVESVRLERDQTVMCT